MAYTQTQIDALKQALATGALTVKHGETLTTFRSLEEIQQIISDMENEVAGSARTKRRRTVAAYRSGT